jgi:hypothetical protein
MLEGRSWLIPPGRLIAIDPAAGAESSAFAPVRRGAGGSPVHGLILKGLMSAGRSGEGPVFNAHI